MAFECPHCGFRNNELQSAGVFNEKGQTVSCKINGKQVRLFIFKLDAQKVFIIIHNIITGS